MKLKKLIIFFLFLFTLLITSCSKTTNLNGTWKNIDSYIVGYEYINLSGQPDIIIKNNTISFDGGNNYRNFEYDKTNGQFEYYYLTDSIPTFYYDKDSKELVFCTYAEISDDEYAKVFSTYKKR